VLCKSRSHQQSAIAPPFNGQLFRACVFSFDQVLCTRVKVVEDVLFFRQITCQMPFFTEFAASTDISNHINSSTIEPDATAQTEMGTHADVITAVAVKNGRIAAIVLGSLAHE